jgi:hypothetical protein
MEDVDWRNESSLEDKPKADYLSASPVRKEAMNSSSSGAIAGL